MSPLRENAEERRYDAAFKRAFFWLVDSDGACGAGATEGAGADGGFVTGGCVVVGATVVVVGAEVEVVVTLAVDTVTDAFEESIEFNEVPPEMAPIMPTMTANPINSPVINHLVLLSHFLFSQTRTSPSGQQQSSATTMIPTFSYQMLDEAVTGLSDGAGGAGGGGGRNGSFSLVPPFD